MLPEIWFVRSGTAIPMQESRLVELIPSPPLTYAVSITLKPERMNCNERHLQHISRERDGAEEEGGQPSVYSEPCCCCGCATDFEEQPSVHYCAEHFDELVILPEWCCWHCGMD